MTDTGTPPNRAPLDARVAANVRAALAWRGIKEQALAPLLAMSSAAVSRRLNAVTAFTAGELILIGRLVSLPAGDLVDRDPWEPPTETTARKEESLPGWPDPDARPTY